MEPNFPLSQPNQPEPAEASPPQPPVPPAPAPQPPEPVVPPTVSPDPPTPASPGPVNPQASIYPEPVMPIVPADHTLSPLPPPEPGRRFGRPKVGLAGMIIILLIIVLGAGAAAYFGYFIPNKPENIWAKSLSNMGKGYDKITSYIDTYPASKGYTLDGNFQTAGDLVSDGTVKAASDGSNGSFDLNFSTHGVKTSLDVLAIKSNTKNPDLYLKVDGLNGLGDLLGGQYAGLGDLLNGVNGQWYFIDHSLLDQYTQSVKSSTSSISKTDVDQMIKAVGDPTKKYIFTSDPNNMAFVIKQKIGKEKIDGRNTYHFKVGIDKNNLKAYDKAVCQNLETTKIFKLLTSGDKNAANDCSDTSDIDKIKDSSTADVWVDTRTKLIHKVRFNNSQDKASFIDLNQDYQGGNNLPLGLDFISKHGGDSLSGSLNLTLDMSTHILTMDGDLKSSGKDSYTGSLKLTMAPSATPVHVAKPAKSKNILQLIDDLGLGGLLGSSGAGSFDNGSSAGPILQ